jgi:protein TonB
LIEELTTRQEQPRGGSFAVSTALHLAALLALSLAVVVPPAPPPEPPRTVMHLAGPRPPAAWRAPRTRPRSVRQLVEPGSFVAPAAVVPARPAEFPAPPLVLAEAPAPVLAVPAPIHAPAPETPAFAGAVSLPPTTHTARPNVAGQFAEAGVAAAPSPRPAPPTTGGGFGDARAGGGSRVAAGSGSIGGFGAAASTPSARPRPLAAAPAGRFGDAQAGGGTARAAASTPVSRPVEILVKPRPIYSEEARRRQIEGEVVLDVIFPASGPVRLVAVVLGLGYGLDEAACDAARAIRFRPAESGGRAIDFPARIRILFQLAY